LPYKRDKMVYIISLILQNLSGFIIWIVEES